MSELTTLIRIPLRAKFSSLPDNTKMLYLNMQCLKCAAHITKRQLNRCIEHNVPLHCIRCYKKLNGEFDVCRIHFNQQSLL